MPTDPSPLLVPSSSSATKLGGVLATGHGPKPFSSDKLRRRALRIIIVLVVVNAVVVGTLLVLGNLYPSFDWFGARYLFFFGQGI